jgi:hypothetical protein
MEGRPIQQMSKNVKTPFRIQFFWDVMLYCSQNFIKFRKIASTQPILDTGNHTQMTRHQIPVDINPQHHCKHANIAMLV